MSQRFYKGRTNNHLTWVMVDATDFATPESAVSAATKIKIYGKLRGAAGVNFVSSGAGSLTNDITHVGASALGIYSIGLAKADLSDASAAWYDHYVINLSATGCAYQTLVAEGVIDDSALSDAVSNAYSAAVQASSRILLVQSRLSDLDSRLVSDISDVLSQLTVIQSMASDAASAAVVGASRILLVQSRLSDLDSRLVSDVSDIRSMLTALSGTESDIYSLLSDLQSDFQSRVPKEVSSKSLLSDVHSDLRSQIGGITATVSASDISDIASAVWANTIGTRVDSRVLLNLSRISDVHSLVSDLQSDFQSRVPKRVATDSQLSDLHSDLRSQIGGITATVSASDISDIASAVRATLVSDLSDILSAATLGSSRILVVQSRLSDLDSRLVSDVSDIRSMLTAMSSTDSDTYSLLSDLRSLVGAGVPLDASTMSDLRSAVLSLSGAISDAHSAAAQANSRTLVLQSNASDIYSLLSDLHSDVGVVSGIISDIYSAATVIDDFLDTEVAAILAAVDTEVAAIKAKTDNLPEGIQKNATLTAFEFYMVDSTDHVSAKTGLTPTCERSIDGGAFAAMTNAPTEVGSGIYKINLATTDTNGDFITFKFTSAGADATLVSFKTEA